MFDTERTWLAWPDLMSAHFDLQPAIAACCAGSAVSHVAVFHRGDHLVNFSLALRDSTFQKPTLRDRTALMRSLPSETTAPKHQCSEQSVPDNLRHLGCRRGVAAALGADDAVDDGHADTRQVAELHAVEDVLAGGMLRPVHDDEIRRAPDFDDAAVQRAHPRGVAGGKAERDFRGHLAER